MDSLDKEIIKILLKDGRQTHKLIGEKLCLSRPAVHQRIKKAGRKRNNKEIYNLNRLEQIGL